MTKLKVLKMKITEARKITGYEKLPYYEYEEGCSFCDYCKETFTRFNSANELKTSYEYDEYNTACNKCVIDMAKAVESGVAIVVGLF